MPFTLIKGTFRPAAGNPDGDSVRFQPDDRDLMRSIPRVRMSATATTVQLRYEGIDALEKHAVQPHAVNARDLNLQLLGTTGASDAQGARGFILTREGDKKSGRPVCFVFAGDDTTLVKEDGADDGDAIFLQSAAVRHSVNYKLMEAGKVYPLFYETLFKELRDELIIGLQDARTAHNEYIILDSSNEGFDYLGPHDLNLLPPIFPKLFRRLDDWNGATLQGFRGWLERNDNERVFILSEGRFLGFQDCLEINGNHIKMIYAPEDMVFRPKPAGPNTD